MGGHYFQLGESAVARPPIRAPSAEVGHVAKPPPLHLFIGDLHNKLRTKRFPRQVLSLAPAALPTWHAMLFRAGRRFIVCPGCPRMIREGILAVGSQEFQKLSP